MSFMPCKNICNIFYICFLKTINNVKIIKILLYFINNKFTFIARFFNFLKKEAIMKKFYISNFYVTTSCNAITINIDIKETSTYRIEVVDLKTNFIQTVVPEIRV